MPSYHISIDWQQSNTRTGGWREGFWLSATSLDVAKTRVLALLDPLNNFKGNPTFSRAYTVSEYPYKRVAESPLTGFSAGVATDATEADYPTVRVQLRLTGTTGQKTTQWIGGIRDRDTKGGGFWRPAATTTRFFNATKTILTNVSNGWSINPLNVAFPKLVVVAFNAMTATVTTGVNHGYANNDYVRIQRLNGVPGINGIWQIRDATATTFALVGWPSSDALMTRSNARVQKQDRVLVPIRDVEIVQVTSHKVGRPTGLLGGRRKRPSKSLVGPLVAK